jgi:gliding motility-associated-like protein
LQEPGTTPSILLNDTLNGLPIVIGTQPGQVTLTPSNVPTGLTVNPDGTLTVDPGTPAGTYTFDYTICENGAVPANCQTATVVINLEFDLEVLNAVTPNDDTFNDNFQIIGIGHYPNNSVEIYNRWGVLVYQADGYINADISFKGTSEGRVTVDKGAQLPEGTYFYILKYVKTDGTAKDQAGYLYIIR